MLEEYRKYIQGNKAIIPYGTKYIDDLVPLHAVQESFERLTSGKDAAVKIIIKP